MGRGERNEKRIPAPLFGVILEVKAGRLG